MSNDMTLSPFYDVMQTVLSEDMMALATEYIKLRQAQVRFDFEIEKIKNEFRELGKSQDRMDIDRDRDRELVLKTAQMLIAMGASELAAKVTMDFIEKRPRHSNEVVKIILAK